MMLEPKPMNTSVGPGLSEVGISPIGGRDYRPFASISSRCHWEVGNTGTASCDIATDDLMSYLGLGVSLKKLRGKWFAADDQDAGRWGGIITDVQPRPRDGLTSISARSWSENLAARRTPKMTRTFTAPAGALVLRILIDAALKDDTLWLTDRQADETGASIALQLRGEKILDLIRRLATRSGQEWWIDQDRGFHWRVRVGVDRSRSRQLVENVHFIDFAPVYSLEPIRNDLFVTPADARYERARGFVAEDADSIAEHGRRQDRIAFAGSVTRSTLLPIAKAELRRLTKKGEVYSFTVLDVDHCWSWFVEGDTVRVVVPSLNLAADIRIMARSLDRDSRTMRVVGVPG